MKEANSSSYFACKVVNGHVLERIKIINELFEGSIEKIIDKWQTDPNPIATWDDVVYFNKEQIKTTFNQPLSENTTPFIALHSTGNLDCDKQLMGEYLNKNGIYLEVDKREATVWIAFHIAAKEFSKRLPLQDENFCNLALKNAILFQRSRLEKIS